MPSLSLRNKLLVLTAVLASLLEIIDTSIVNVAVPTMMGNLGATIDEISWVITGYIIANAIVLPIAGWMSEQLGRKNYYTTCIATFTLASVACGLAPNLPTLVVFRVIQGFAGGALLPTSQALIYEAFPKEQAGMASAIYGMSVLVGPTVAPTLGGYLTDQFGWRSIFNINLPLGIIVALLSYFLVDDLPETQAHRENKRPVDVLGLVFLVIGIGALQFVLERGHADDWFDSGLITLMCFAAVAGLAALIWWELRVKHPILELRQFKNSTFRNGILLMAGLGGSLYGLLFLVPIFCQQIQGFTATQTGELFIPGALCAALCMPFIGTELRKGTDPRRFIFAGIVGLSFGLYLISGFDTQTSAGQMFTPLLIRGVATGMLFVPLNNLVLTQFTGAGVGAAAGMLNLCRQLGGSVSIAIASTLLQRAERTNYSVLSQHVTVFDPVAMKTSANVAHGFAMKLPDIVGFGGVHTAALKILDFKIRVQSFVLGFQEIMFILGAGFLFALFPLWWMKPKKQRGGAVDVAAH